MKCLKYKSYDSFKGEKYIKKKTHEEIAENI